MAMQSGVIVRSATRTRGVDIVLHPLPSPGSGPYIIEIGRAHV